MAEWFANMNIALYRIDTAGKTTQKPAAYEVPRGKIRSIKHENTKVHIALREFPR